MSDIIINTCPPQETAQNSAAKKRKSRSRWFRKKLQFLKEKGVLDGKQRRHQAESRDYGTHLLNGAYANHQTLPDSSQSKTFISDSSQHKSFLPISSASQCDSKSSASTQTKPSLNFTVSNDKMPTTKSTQSESSSHKATTSMPLGLPTKYVAIDCEMVGAGPKGSISQLARCSIVSHDGGVIYDKFIIPSMPITDYRTRWSGIRRSDLYNATPFSQAKKEILKLLMGKVVIGHAVHNDFKALGYVHPAALIRDTSRIPLLNQKAGFGLNECASLKRLTKAIFNRDIQTGKKGHSSVEDAKATMELYKLVEVEWERKLATKMQTSSSPV